MSKQYEGTKYAKDYVTVFHLVPDTSKPAVEGVPVPNKHVAIGRPITIKGKGNLPDKIVPQASPEDLKWLVETKGVPMYPYIQEKIVLPPPPANTKKPSGGSKVGKVGE